MTADAPPPSPSAFADSGKTDIEVAVSDAVRLPENVVSLAAEAAPKNVVQKSGGSGSGQKRGGSGLPKLAHVQWEKCTDRPGFKAWHAPQGNNAPRNTKTYLGYVGKKLLTEWEAMAAAERAGVVARWIAERRKEKGMIEPKEVTYDEVERAAWCGWAFIESRQTLLDLIALNCTDAAVSELHTTLTSYQTLRGCIVEGRRAAIATYLDASKAEKGIT